MTCARVTSKWIFCVALLTSCSVFYSWQDLETKVNVLREENEEIISGVHRTGFNVNVKLSRRERFKYHCPYIPPHAENITDIFSNETVANFRNQVSRFNKSRPIIVIVANQQGMYLVANWMCISRMTLRGPPTENLLIVIPGPEKSQSADYLLRNGIAAVRINLNEKCLQQLETVRVLELHSWYKALTMRILTVMLLTDWGYDVMVHDPDAFIIKDPFQFYSDIIKAKDPHIVAQKGEMPQAVSAKWGFTLVMGAILYRSSPHLHELWRKVSELHFTEQDSLRKQLDDQKLTNLALFTLGVEWDHSSTVHNSTFGQTASGLRVVALDVTYSFRGNAEQIGSIDTLSNSVLVFHPTIGHDLDSKIEKLQEMNLWQMIVNERNFKDFLKNGTNNAQTLLGKICKRRTKL